MATYFFETITAAQALAYNASTDSLIFGQAGENARATVVAVDEANGSFDLVSGLTGKAITLPTGGAGEVPLFADASVLHLGSASNDSAAGGAAADGLYGAAGADTLDAAAGSDILDGGSGDDRLTGGAGRDTLLGGAGADTFVFAKGDSGVAEGMLDVVSDWQVGDRLMFHLAATSGDYVETTAGAYAAALSFANDLIASGAANYVAAQVGADVIVFADSGENDGTADDAVVLAGASLASIDVAAIIGGGPAPDLVSETLSGATGADSLDGGAGNDAVSGGDGGDSLAGGDGDDQVNGDGGNDYLTGGAGGDTLSGGAGDDTVAGGVGADLLRGGDGNDLFTFAVGDTSLVAGLLDVVADWDGSDALWFGAAASDLNYLELTATSYESARAMADTMIGSGTADFVAVQLGGDVVVFADSRANNGGADDAVVLVGRSLADISAANLAAAPPPPVPPPEPPPEPPPPPPPAPPPSGGGGGSGGGGEQFRTPNLWGAGEADSLDLGDGAQAYGAGGGDDSVLGGAGDDLIYGGDGADTVMGGLDNDTVVGGEGASYLRGDEGDDRIVGGPEFDDINGNMGRDTINGGLGDDWVVGGKDADILFGETGRDIVYGNIGDDVLSGGLDDDLVRGGQGSDMVRGDNGDDWLSGDRGSDTMDGGLGADILHTFSEAGLDLVIGFSVSEGDRVQVDPGTVYAVSQAGADVVIDMGGDNRMVLVGVQLASLPEGWIFGA